MVNTLTKNSIAKEKILIFAMLLFTIIGINNYLKLSHTQTGSAGYYISPSVFSAGKLIPPFATLTLVLKGINDGKFNITASTNLPEMVGQDIHGNASSVSYEKDPITLNLNDHRRTANTPWALSKDRRWAHSDVKEETSQNDFFYPFNYYALEISPSLTIFATSYKTPRRKTPGTPYVQNYDSSNLFDILYFKLSNRYTEEVRHVTHNHAPGKNLSAVKEKNSTYVVIYHPLWFKMLVLLIICFAIVPIMILQKVQREYSALDFFAYIMTLSTFRVWLFGTNPSIHFIDMIFLMLTLYLSIHMLIQLPNNNSTQS